MRLPRLLVHLVLVASIVLGIVVGTRLYAFFAGG
jgi:hypothetical protein